MRSQIDLLVAGELPDEQRRDLFEWCNQDPIRWRQCALAFLEAQTWHQGLATWTQDSITSDSATNGSVKTVVTPDLTTHRRNEYVSSWRTWGVLAASLVIAFLAGVFVRDPVFYSARLSDGSENRQPATGVPRDGAELSEANSPTNVGAGLAPTYVSVPVRTNLNPGVPSVLQIPVAAPEKKPHSAPAKQKMPEYVRKQWEKRGYQVAQTERFLNAKLPDGRDVVVPVSGLAVKYVGKPVY